MPVSLPVLVVAWLVTAGAAAVQATVGSGFAVVSVPVLALVDPRLVPVPQLLVALPMTITMAWRERRAMELSRVTWILAGRLPGAAAGLVLLKMFDGRHLDVAIAVIVMAVVAAMAMGLRVRRNPATEFGTGIAAGVTGLVASIGGPPVALLYSRERGPLLRSNLAAVFSVGILISVATRVGSAEITSTDWQVAAWLLPAVAAGYLIGGRFTARVEGPQLRHAILALSAAAAFGLLARSL